MASNWLKLNDDKTEFIILSMPTDLAKVATEAIIVRDHRTTKCHHACNIGAIFDLAMEMEAQISKVLQTA